MSTPDVNGISIAIAEFAQSLYPGFRSAKLRVVLADGEVATFPVSAQLLIRAGRPTLETPGGAMESAILEALAEINTGEKPTGEALADLAGYPFNGRFREALARLVRSNSIRNHRPGYSLPE